MKSALNLFSKLIAISGILLLGAAAQAKTACFKDPKNVIGRITVDNKLIVVLYDLNVEADYAKESGWTQKYKKTGDVIQAQAYLQGVGDGATTIVVLSEKNLIFKGTDGAVWANYPVVACPTK